MSAVDFCMNSRKIKTLSITFTSRLYREKCIVCSIIYNDKRYYLILILYLSTGCVSIKITILMNNIGTKCNT